MNIWSLEIDSIPVIKLMAESIQGTVSFVVIMLLLAISIECQQQAPKQRYFVPMPGALQDQDIYGNTIYLTSFYSRYSNLNSGTQFNLGFTNSTPGVFTLAILMNVDPSITNSPERSGARVIWEANRNDPVGLNASLTEEFDGDLVLRDFDGRLVWNTGTGGMNVTQITVLESGNLVVLSNETILWQSFDRPSDSLMAGQVLKPGASIRSRKSLSDPSPGDYTLVMEPGGLVLYSTSSGAREPYWITSYEGATNSLDEARRSCGSRPTEAVLDGTALSLNFNIQLSNSSAPPNTSSSSCTFNQTRAIFIRNSNVVQNVSFIRLEYDGNLRVYTLESLQLWETSHQVINESRSCSLPGRCGSFGLCSGSSGACTVCINQDGSNSPWSNDCSRPRVDSCTDFESLNFLRVPGTDHFSSKYLVNSSSSFEDCQNRCLQDCSCPAFFFWEESNSCFFAVNDTIGTLESVPNQSHVAYIKATRVPRSRSGLATGAIAGVVVGVVLSVVMVSVVVAVIWIKRRRSIEAVDYDSDNFLESIENLRPIRFSHEDLERITDGFSRILGVGGFGGVYEGTLPDGRKVAVKKLESSGQGKKEFYAEVAVLGTLHHFNLVKLLGFCSQTVGSHRLLVYEHMANGSLDKWIFSNTEEKFLNWGQRLEILVGMARGLAYLHEECMQRIIHLDIKPQNILLDEDFVAKVADFGLSRLMARDESFVMTTMRGTPGYLAPEWLLEAAITEKSDVYSFGVVVLEVISGRKNFSRISSGVSGSGTDEKFYLPAYALELVTQGREAELLDPWLKAPEEEVRRCVRIAFQCLQEDASARPSMGNVVQMLEGGLEVKEVDSKGLFFSARPPTSNHQQLFSGSSYQTSNASSASNAISFPMTPPSFR